MERLVNLTTGFTSGSFHGTIASPGARSIERRNDPRNPQAGGLPAISRWSSVNDTTG